MFNEEPKPPSTNKPLYGFYRGVVMDNKDPEIELKSKSYGCIKVHVPAIADDTEAVLIAYPANNPIGGRNSESISSKKDSNGGKQEFSGSFMVPPNNAMVWVFFENGDPNRPYYFSGCDIEAHEAPPEIQVGIDKKPEERWIIFRSPHGRVIAISDDPDNCRIEITGKKRFSAENSDGHVYEIIGNQKTILIDDREGKEKILLSDEKGNYININTAKETIDIHANQTVKIDAGQAIYLSAPHMGYSFQTISCAGAGNVNCNIGGDFNFMTNGNTSMRASGSTFIDSPNLQTNSGGAAIPGNDGAIADEPVNGDRK